MNLRKYADSGYKIEVFSRWHEEPGCARTPRYGVRVGGIVVKEFLTAALAQEFIIQNWGAYEQRRIPYIS